MRPWRRCARSSAPSRPCASAARTRRAKVGFEVVSPIDRDWLLGRFPHGTRRRRGRCRGCRAGCLPGLGRDALAGAGAPVAARRRADRGACLHALGGGRAGDRQEPHGGARRGAGDGRPGALVLRADAGQPGLRPRAARRPAAGLPQPQPHAAAALRRLGGDRALQLPVRAGRRTDRRGAGRRQHGGLQGGERHRLERRAAR